MSKGLADLKEPLPQVIRLAFSTIESIPGTIEKKTSTRYFGHHQLDMNFLNAFRNYVKMMRKTKIDFPNRGTDFLSIFINLFAACTRTEKSSFSNQSDYQANVQINFNIQQMANGLTQQLHYTSDSVSLMVLLSGEGKL